MSLDSIVSVLLQWPTDWVLICTFAVLVTVDALRSGAGKAASLAFALPISLLALSTLPHSAFIGLSAQQLATNDMATAAVFLVFIVAFYLFARRTLGFWDDTAGAPLQSVLIGISCAIIVVIMWLHVPALASIWSFSPQLHAIFGEAYRLWWMIAAYATLAYVRS